MNMPRVQITIDGTTYPIYWANIGFHQQGQWCLAMERQMNHQPQEYIEKFISEVLREAKKQTGEDGLTSEQLPRHLARQFMFKMRELGLNIDSDKWMVEACDCPIFIDK